MPYRSLSEGESVLHMLFRRLRDGGVHIYDQDEYENHWYETEEAAWAWMDRRADEAGEDIEYPVVGR